MNLLIIIIQLLILIYAIAKLHLLAVIMILLLGAYALVSLLYVKSKEKLIDPIQVKKIEAKEVLFFAIIAFSNYLAWKHGYSFEINYIYVALIFISALVIKVRSKNDC